MWPLKVFDCHHVRCLLKRFRDLRKRIVLARSFQSPKSARGEYQTFPKGLAFSLAALVHMFSISPLFEMAYRGRLVFFCFCVGAAIVVDLLFA